MTRASQNSTLREALLASLQARHGHCTAMFPDEQELLASLDGKLDLAKWQSYLVGWARALSAYQTPLSFVAGVEYSNTEFEIRGARYRAICVKGARYTERAKLMAAQKPYLPISGWQEYGVRLDASCLLCQNVAQGVDATSWPGRVANPIIFDIGDYIVLPNRYPARPGAALFLSKHHDIANTRVPLPPRGVSPRVIQAEVGKTRGNILTAQDLTTLFELCDAFDFIAVRNHVLDAMSIPEHDHFHVAPVGLPAFQVFREQLLGSLQVSAGVGYAEATPFDTIVLSDDDRSNLVLRAIRLLQRLESEHQVFTVAYYSGKLLVSPRNAERLANRSITLGSTAPLHTFDTPDGDFIRMLNDYIPKRGEFGWQRFLD